MAIITKTRTNTATVATTNQLNSITIRPNGQVTVTIRMAWNDGTAESQGKTVDLAEVCTKAELAIIKPWAAALFSRIATNL